MDELKYEPCTVESEEACAAHGLVWWQPLRYWKMARSVLLFFLERNEVFAGSRGAPPLWKQITPGYGVKRHEGESQYNAPIVASVRNPAVPKRDEPSLARLCIVR